MKTLLCSVLFFSISFLNAQEDILNLMYKNYNSDEAIAVIQKYYGVETKDDALDMWYIPSYLKTSKQLGSYNRTQKQKDRGIQLTAYDGVIESITISPSSLTKKELKKESWRSFYELTYPGGFKSSMTETKVKELCEFQSKSGEYITKINDKVYAAVGIDEKTKQLKYIYYSKMEDYLKRYGEKD